MRRYFFILIATFSILSHAAKPPRATIDFTHGAYLGEGRWITTLGYKGSYSSYANISPEEWTAAYVKDGKLTSYNASFNFSEHGFFNVDVTQYASDGRRTEHAGHGYCIFTTCHLSVDLDQGLLEEALTFFSPEKRIERMGSIRYIDENGEGNTIAWKDTLYLIDQNEDDDDEDEKMSERPLIQ